LPFDFHKSLTEKIAALRPSTPVTRRAVYDAARENLLAHVRAAAPNISVATVVTQQRELEQAILAIENEARPHDPPAPPPPPVPKRPPEPKPEPPAIVDEVADGGEQSETEEKSEEVVEAEPASDPEPAAGAVSASTPEPVADAAASAAELPSADLPPDLRSRPELLPEEPFPAADEPEQAPEAEANEPTVAAPRAGTPWKVVIYVGTAAVIGATIVFAAAAAWRALDIRPAAPSTANVSPTTKPVEAPPAASALIAGAGFNVAAQASLKQGIGLLAQGDLDRAILALDDSIRLDPTQPAAYGHRAFAHWRKGAAELAARDYGDAVRLDPKNIAYRLNRAIASNKVGSYDTAIVDLDEVLRAEPENPVALNSRCWARAVLGALEEALLDCNQAVRLAPKDANNFDTRGFLHLKSGRLVRAVADYSSALRIDPKLASSLYGRGLAKIGRGDRAGGTEDVATAKALNPDIQAEFARHGVR
jgi:tetratricopeptide (TPR) repeat protein